MPHRTARKVWVGRAVALIVIAALAAYLLSVGLDKADKVASAVGLLIAVSALVTPYLLPPAAAPAQPPTSAATAPPGPVTVTHSYGIQVNQSGGNVQNNSWSLISFVLNPWVATFAVVALAAVVALVLYLRPWAAVADVRLVGYSVAPPATVGGTSFEVGSMGGGPMKRTDQGPAEVPATPVDITLKNNGSASAVVVEAVVEVVFAEYLEDCAQTGGPLQVEANYDVPLPLQPPARPFSVRHSMRFEVEPHRSERFTLTIGPQEQGVESWDARVYVADISLKLDYTDEELKVGRAGWVTQSGDGYDNLNASLGTYEPCLKANADIMTRFGRLDAQRSEEAATLTKRWAHLTAPDGSVYTPTCQPYQPYDPSVEVSGYCVIYTRKFLAARVSLNSSEQAGERDLLLRMIGSDGEVRRSVRCRVTDRATPLQVSLVPADTKPAAVAPCSDQGQASVMLYAYPDPEIDEAESFVSVEVVPVGTQTLPSADGAPSTLVKRSE